jgi:hypothetical protein
MNKEETIERYGEEAWAKRLEQRREYYKEHKEQETAYQEKYREEHPKEVKAASKRSGQEQSRKGGKHYDKMLEAMTTGLRGDRHKIRTKHAKQYKPYKQIIAPESQIHHEWIPQTSEYRGVALVEADQHMHGFVDVIEILYGKITLLTEEQIRNGGV